MCIRDSSYYKESLLPLFETFPFSEGRKKMMARCRYPLPDLVDYLKEKDPPVQKINIPYVQPEIRDELLMRLNRIENICVTSVSYTHLDVYKRQPLHHCPSHRPAPS